MAKISAMARRELLEAVSERYRKGSTHEKRRILDEFVALTGHHRKHAIHLLRTIPGKNELRKARSRSRVYDEAIRTALTVLWEASDRVGGKRLKPLVAVLVPALERHGHMSSMKRSVRFSKSAFANCALQFFGDFDASLRAEHGQSAVVTSPSYPFAQPRS
jgi:hypothetical protein